jgi:hypothetical protein
MLAVITLALATAGCAVDSAYPSLAPRPIEDMSLAEPAQRPVPVGTPSAIATAHYAPSVEKARAADADFRATLAEARGALDRGRGAADGSDEWLAAQQALSRVETARDIVTAVLGDLDAARNGDIPSTDSGEAAAVARAYEEVRALDMAEAQALSAAWPGK